MTTRRKRTGICLSLPPALLSWVDEQGRQHDMSRSAYVTLVLSVQRRGEGLAAMGARVSRLEGKNL